MPALRMLRFWAVGTEKVSKMCPSTIIFEPEIFESVPLEPCFYEGLRKVDRVGLEPTT